jgi:small multidrug resistance family-3 protein
MPNMVPPPKIQSYYDNKHEAIMGSIEITKSVGYFVLAGLFEIGGGYLIWLWIREGKPVLYALIGAVILVIYGVIPTLQPANFGRVYAAYGGVFIVLSIIWGWRVDKITPDRFDIIGGVVALVGVCIIMYWPRS